ncbi:MAG: glycosyltransferase family 4 protein [bacterium]
MRILMIAPQPFFQPRGTPFSVLHRLKALSRLGYQLDLLTYHLGENVEIEGVTIHRIPRVPLVKKIAVGPSKSKVWVDVFVILKAMKMLRQGRYDLIHSHEEAGFFAAYLAKKYQTLHLYDMHSSLPQQLSNFRFTRSSFLVKWFEKLESYTINSADAVITICPELYNYVKQRFPNQFSILIENVADNSLVFGQATNPTNVQKTIKTNGERIVLYTGTFEPYQGIDLLIEAGKRVLQQAQDVKFVLVGGKPEQIRNYQDKVDELNLGESFIFTGSVMPQQVPQYIEASDILVSPRTDGNNTPLKIYSYLRSGKPIVATRHITHTQVLNEAVSVLTDCTPEAFGNGVLKVLQDPGLSQEIADNARVLAQQNYSYESYLKKTSNVYTYLESQLEYAGGER